MPIKEEFWDDLLKHCKTSEDIFGQNSIIKQFVKAVSERALKAKLSHHLG